LYRKVRQGLIGKRTKQINNLIINFQRAGKGGSNKKGRKR
jgi:hypothetical protein